MSKYHPTFREFFRKEVGTPRKICSDLRELFVEWRKILAEEKGKEKIECLVLPIVLLFLLPWWVYREWREKRCILVDEFLKRL